MRSAPAIAFDYRPSFTLAAALVVMMVLAWVAIHLCGLGLPLKLAFWGASLVWSADGLLRLFRPSYTRVAHGESGWTLVDRNGNEISASLAQYARLGFVQMLDFKAERRFRLVLMPDNLDAQTRRKLALLLARADALS